MKIKSWGKTDTGLVRSTNQDFILMDHKRHLYAVADGMGGHTGGDIASHLAISAMSQYFSENLSNSSKDPEKLITAAYQEATKKVYEENLKISQMKNVELNEEHTAHMYGSMGTTLVCAFIHEDVCYFANVGDSRAYVFDKQEKKAYQITEDHSLVYENLKRGLITEEEMLRSNHKNIITRNIGFTDVIEVDLFKRKCKSNDRIILCSDGLCGYVNHEECEKSFSHKDGQEVIDECFKIAEEKGGHDNISVICIDFV